MRRLAGTGGGILVSWFAVLVSTQAVTLEVRDGNSTCIKAELTALLSITYNTSVATRTALIPLPDSASVDAAGSSCGISPRLAAAFGPGHGVGLSFSTNGSLYGVNNLTLQFNLSDSALFPDAVGAGMVVAWTPSAGIWAAINTTYRCRSSSSLEVGGGAITLTAVRLQAFMTGNDLSAAETVCMADQAVTLAPPPTPGPAPTAAPGPPPHGSYSVRTNGSACLLAQMGLQLNISYVSGPQKQMVQKVLNLDPSLMTTSGRCEAASAALSLAQQRTAILNFTFTLNFTTNRYHLSGVQLQADWPDMAAPFSAGNDSLDLLRSSFGRSYLCAARQSLTITPTFSLNTFRLQVQPFAVTADKFSSAEECQMDQDQMLIPIIVGAALAGLVLIILIAYLIGRKRSHAGYQTI